MPGATLTGICTFINGNGIWDESETDWPEAIHHAPQEIEVVHISTDMKILEEAKSVRYP